MICWECEEETFQATMAAIPSQPNCITLLPLCPQCYQQCYLPLVTISGAPQHHPS
jgi:hypothetical protein